MAHEIGLSFMPTPVTIGGSGRRLVCMTSHAESATDTHAIASEFCERHASQRPKVGWEVQLLGLPVSKIAVNNPSDFQKVVAVAQDRIGKPDILREHFHKLIGPAPFQNA
jgi:hypothetical protein